MQVELAFTSGHHTFDYAKLPNGGVFVLKK